MDDTDLDVCPHCRGEIRFGELPHHESGACVPEREEFVPGLVGRMSGRQENPYIHESAGRIHERMEALRRRMEEVAMAAMRERGGRRR